MKSVVCHGAKDLRLDEQASPELKDHQALIKVSAGGICGSDLHYYNHGGFGDIRIKEPMTLGHEVSGYVIAIENKNSHLKVGDLVAINPSRPCGHCDYCYKGIHNQCLHMQFYGSAMRFPHIQGAFSEEITANEIQCVKFDSEISPHHAAFAEPLSVAISAIRKIKNLIGKRILVTGVGPIGALVVATARAQGALEIVATDVVENPLGKALAVGADKIINVSSETDWLNAYSADKGYFDAIIEASGNEVALRSAINVLKPRGQLILLGLGGEVQLPLNQVVAKEINLSGSFRFHEEFNWAVEMINNHRILLDPLLTNIFPITQAHQAFEIASDRDKAMKVQLTFN